MVERARLWCRRQPLRAGLVVALVLTVLAGSGAVIVQWRRATHERRRADDAAALAQREHYAARLAFAQSLIEQSQFIRAQHTLADAGPESLRGWEWGWLLRACHRDQMTLSAGGAGLTSIAFSPDGRLLAAGGFDQAARIWELPGGRESSVLRGHGDLVFVGGFSPDGKRLVTASWDKTARIWDVASGALLRTLAGHDDLVYCAQFSPDARWIATGGKDGTVRLWDSTTGELLRTLAHYEDGSVMSVAWSRDGRWLAFAGGSGLVGVTRPAGAGVLNLATGNVRAWRGHAATIPAVAFSPDSRTIATASWDGMACIAELATDGELRPVLEQANRGPLFSAAFSADGDSLAVAGAARGGGAWTSIVDLRTGRVTQSVEGHSQPVRAVAFSPNGTRLATASFDGTAKLWSLPARAEHLSLEGHDQAVWAVTASPDGRLLATGSADHTAKIWEAADGRWRATIAVGFPVVSLAFTADGTGLISNGAGNTASVWPVPPPGGGENGEPLVLRGHDGVVLAVAVDSGGRWLATGAKDGTARLWNASNGTCERILAAHEDWVTGVNFSADGARLVTASADRTAAIWETDSGRRAAVLCGHEGAVLRAVFSPDGLRVAAGSTDHTARLWDAGTGAPMGAPLTGHTDSVGGLAFSPDGARLVTTGAGVSLLTGAGRDSTVNVWDAGTGHVLLRLRPHDNQMLAAAFTPDGRSLITGSADHTARVLVAFPWQMLEYAGGPEAGTEEDRIERFKRNFFASEGPENARRDRRVEFRSGGEVNTAERLTMKTRPARPIVPRLVQTTGGQVDLTACYNAALDEAWQPVEGLWRIDADLAALPAGELVHDGTVFDVRGAIQLSSDGDDWRAFPSCVQIPIHRAFARLHVIHGGVAAWVSETEGRSVAAYRLHYADGRHEDLEVRYGAALRAFWTASDARTDCADAKTAWQWQSPFPVRPRDALPDARRLYHVTFANPRPGVVVREIGFLTRGSHVAPFLVAMTVE